MTLVALPAATVRRLEADTARRLPPGTLMARASTALAVEAAAMLRDLTGRVTGSRVVLLVGAGDNGGDALFAGARLAGRGARVDALLVADRHHVEGGSALSRAGGRLHQVSDLLPAAELLAAADLVVDGILGIGGRGGLRGVAAALAAVAREVDATVLAVDLPSGVDADTGAVADADAVVLADRTLAFGVLKPGLLVPPGAAFAGDVALADIGLDPTGGDEGESLLVVDDRLAAADLARPTAQDDKYSRGVVGVSTGSQAYPGAAVLSTGGARHGFAGFVRYAGPARAEVVRAWPDVVATDDGDAGRVQAWVVGSGRGLGADAREAVAAALAGDAAVVLDADALTLLAGDEALRAQVRARSAVTVLTPHAGEFARLGGGDVTAYRVAAVRALARELAAVVLLKGSATIVTPPQGAAYVSSGAPAELATAGSGDVLAGLLGSLLAHHAARTPVTHADAARLAAVAARVHGVAGSVAAGEGRSVTATDVLDALPEAVRRVRAGVASDT